MQFRFVAVAGATVAMVTLASAQEQAETLPLAIETGEATHTLNVEIADDPNERAKGLMYRRSMADDHGMLFDFGEERDISMWMKNTYLPLDMVFIEADGEVISIARRTTPLSEKTIDSGGPVRYVLEINGGRAKELGIEPGDSVSGPAISSE